MPAVLRRAGLPAGFFQQEKIYVTTAELFALWRAIGETSTDPAIGLKLGAEPRFERYQPSAIAAVCSRSFRDALQRIARYKKLTCPEEIRVRTSGDEASVEFIYLEADEIQPDVLVDLGLSWILAIGRRGTDGQITPLRLELTRSPRTASCWNPTSAAGFASKPAATHSSSATPTSTARSSPRTKSCSRPSAPNWRLNSRSATPAPTSGEQVKHTLKRSLAGKRPTLQQVARELCTSARTLQRRLTDADITFQQLVEDTRRELAHHYLRHSTVELNETAFLLGYEDSNSFFRAFQGWEGTSPGEWRTRHRMAHAEVLAH